MTKDEWLARLKVELNDAQYEAVTAQAGPLLVISGPGSGKTRVLVYRAAHLIHEGTSPRRILSVTFTKKAAGELQTRLNHLGVYRTASSGGGGSGGGIICGTFHSICARFLREFAAAVGLKRDFAIYDEVDQQIVMRTVLEEVLAPTLSEGSEFIGILEDLGNGSSHARLALGRKDDVSPEEVAAPRCGNCRRDVAWTYLLVDAGNLHQAGPCCLKHVFVNDDSGAEAAELFSRAFSEARRSGEDVETAKAAAKVLSDRYLGMMDKAKNRYMSPADVKESIIAADGATSEFSALFPTAYERYEERLLENNAIDFGGLLCKALDLCRDQAVGPELAARFDHVLADEQQDVNRVQHLLLKHLASKSGSITAIGDEDQSIYAFRSADPRYILNFDRDYPGCKTIYLAQNYRSTATIVKASRSVIENNSDRRTKDLRTDNGEGTDIKMHPCEDERHEAEVVSSAIRSYLDDGVPAKEIAIIYRVNSMSHGFERYLRGLKVPYKIVGGTTFYERKEVRDCLAYLRAVANPDDDVALERIVNVPPRKIGDDTVSRVRRFYPSQKLLGALRSATSDKRFRPATRENIDWFLRTLEEHRKKLGEVVWTAVAPEVAAHQIWASMGYLAYLEGTDQDKDESRMGNVSELQSDIKRYHDEAQLAALDITGFLEWVSLVSGEREEAASSGKGDVPTESISLMTAHKSKGLEMDVVFVVGLEKGLFPHSRSVEESGLSEERRIYYVSITRARKHLHLSWAAMRTTFGKTSTAPRSVFVAETMKHCQ